MECLSRGCKYALPSLIDEQNCFIQWPGKINQGGKSKEICRENERSVRRCSVATEGVTYWSITGKPLAHGKAQINRKGLI